MLEQLHVLNLPLAALLEVTVDFLSILSTILIHLTSL